MKDQTPFIELQRSKGNAKVIVLTVGADNPSPFKPHHKCVWESAGAEIDLTVGLDRHDIVMEETQLWRPKINKIKN